MTFKILLYSLLGRGFLYSLRVIYLKLLEHRRAQDILLGWMDGWMRLAEGVASFLFFLCLFPLSPALGGGPDPWLQSSQPSLVSHAFCPR